MQITTLELNELVNKFRTEYNKGHDEGKRTGINETELRYKPYKEKYEQLEKEYDYLKIKLSEFQEYEPQRTETINRLMRENAEHVATIDNLKEELEKYKKEEYCLEMTAENDKIKTENEALKGKKKYLEEVFNVERKANIKGAEQIEEFIKKNKELEKENENLKFKLKNT